MVRQGQLLTLLFFICVFGAAGLNAQNPPAGQRVRGRVNPAENQSPGSPVPGIPGMPPVARGNQARLTGKSAGGVAVDLTAAIAVDGSFEFPNVPSGGYEVTVLPSAIPPTSIVVGDAELPELQLGPPLARILGTVIVEGGGPLPRFQLEWTDVSPDGTGAGGVLRRKLETSGAGFASDMPAGAFRVAATGLPAGFSVRSMTADAVDLARAPLTVRSGETARIAITLSVAAPPPWVKVSGRVTGRAGPAPESTIRLRGPAIAETLTAAVGPDGSFEFPKALPGQYEARLLPASIPFVTTFVVGATDLRDVTIALPTTKDLVGEFVKIEPGEFMMGCSPIDVQCQPQETPPHRVGITKGFEIGKYEVTQAQWETVMGTNPSQFKGRDRPVENVNTWLEAQEFIGKLNTLGDGYRYRLPTEAEWEYAARAGSVEPYVGLLDAVAWYSGNSGNQTHPVGQKLPNAWGLYDTLGNVAEWVEDWFSPTYYSESPALDPPGPAAGSQRIARGGSRNDVPLWIRVSFRGKRGFPIAERDSFGIRLVREVSGQ